MRTFRILASALVHVGLVLLAAPASAQIVANGTTLTVTTTNAVATFKGADLVGFTNVLTGENYLKKPSNGELAFVDTIPFINTGLSLPPWTVGAGGAQLVRTDGTRTTFTMTVSIDPASQEIVIRSSAAVTTPGVRAAWWSVAGLDLDGGRWILPAHTGMVFDSTHPGVGVSVDYPFPWSAQMAVYEAALGSFVLYSTDQQFL